MLLREIDIALKTCPNGGNDGYITPRPCQCEVEGLVTEINELKTRAEALENAIRKECYYCNHNACKLPCGCINFNGWQFDQEQFSSNEEVLQF